MGCSVDVAFKEFEDRPIAAASLGQVLSSNISSIYNIPSQCLFRQCCTISLSKFHYLIVIHCSHLYMFNVCLYNWCEFSSETFVFYCEKMLILCH
jgi:hypothetical protein